MGHRSQRLRTFDGVKMVQNEVRRSKQLLPTAPRAPQGPSPAPQNRPTRRTGITQGRPRGCKPRAATSLEAPYQTCWTARRAAPARSAERGAQQIADRSRRAHRQGRAGRAVDMAVRIGVQRVLLSFFRIWGGKKGTSLVSRSKHPITSVLAVRSSLDLSRSIAGTFQQ